MDRETPSLAKERYTSPALLAIQNVLISRDFPSEIEPEFRYPNFHSNPNFGSRISGTKFDLPEIRVVILPRNSGGEFLLHGRISGGDNIEIEPVYYIGAISGVPLNWC